MHCTMVTLTIIIEQWPKRILDCVLKIRIFILDVDVCQDVTEIQTRSKIRIKFMYKINIMSLVELSIGADNPNES